MTLTNDSFGDTFGHSSNQIDLKSVNGIVKENNLILTFNFFNSISPASYYQDNSVIGTIYLDLDRNSNTGTPLYSDIYFPKQSEGIILGYEVSVDLYSEEYQYGLVNLIDETDYSTIGQVPIYFEQDSLQIEIPLTLLGDDGELDFSAIVGANYELTDTIPDRSVAKVSLIESEETEPNDEIASAIDTGLDSDRVGHFFVVGEIGNNPQVKPSQDLDFYQVKLEAGDYLAVDIDASAFNSSLNSELQLFDSQGNLIVSNDDNSYSWDSSIEFTAKITDTYYISVSGVEHNYPQPLEDSKEIIFPVDSGTGSYNLDITLFSPTVVTGTATDDVLKGTKYYDVISGLEGNDDIFAWDGDDRISAGDGHDFVRGGKGSDRIWGDRGNDLILGDAQEDIIDGGDGIDALFGGEGNDAIKGGADKDRIFGGNGDDVIKGQDGNDVIFGGADFDRIFGGKGNDVIVGGNGDDRLYGQDDEDLIRGGTGSDYIYGGIGNDTLVGVNQSELGSYELDYFTGGLGQDTFILGNSNYLFYDDRISSSIGESDYALITDFDASEDKIQLHGSAQSYHLDFFSYGDGTTHAALVYDGGVSERDEQIAVLEGVSEDLTLTELAFVFV
jgi:Ca2+-binding RTX toxin-like protein